jgi:hypothetical protein
LGEWEMMSSEEIDLMHTRDWGTPCSNQLTEDQLIDKLETALEDDDVTPTESQVKKVITQCYKLVYKARRNDGSLEGDFDSAVEHGVNVILSYLDLRSLEGGKDISDLLSMYPFGYSRDKGLYRYCPKEMVSDYLSEITRQVCQAEENIAAQNIIGDIFSNDSSDLEYSNFCSLDLTEKFAYVMEKMTENIKKLTKILSIGSSTLYQDEISTINELVNKTEELCAKLVPESNAPKLNFFKGELEHLRYLERRQVGDRTLPVLEEYTKLYGGNKCSDYLSGILARFDIVSPSMCFIDKTDIKWVADNYNREHKFKLLTRIEELKDHISHEISIRKDNSYELDKYILSLFKIVEETAKVLNPSPAIESREEIVTLFRCMNKSKMSDFETFRAIWLCSKDRAIEYSKEGLPNGISYMDLVEYLCLLNDDHHGDGVVSHECKNITIIQLMYDSFVSSIEASLLENGIKYDIFYYQDKFGIFLTDKITDISIISANKWTLKTVRTFANELGHRITYSNKHKLQALERLPMGKYVLGDISGVTDGNEVELAIPHSGKSKSIQVAKGFCSVKAHKIISALKHRGYLQSRSAGIDVWVKSKELYAYFCYKITDVLISPTHQIETKYISENYIAYNGNIKTVSRYATGYRNKKKDYPDGYKSIDSIIEAGANGQL